MVKLFSRMPVVALQALLLACDSGSHQPEPPAVATPPSAPDPKADPKVAPKDSGGTGTYPWQSGPIAAL